MTGTRLSILTALVGLACVVGGCDHEFDLSTLPQNTAQALDTSYVLLDPPFGGFVEPEDVFIGNDQLLYVVDRGGNRVSMLNRAGQLLSSRFILHPLAIGQDSRLDLIVSGEVVTSSGDTVGALFRIHLVSTSPDSAHRLDVARMDTLWRELARPARRFPGMTVFGDNQYLVVRNGPDNSSFVDPDARVLLFGSNDAFITPIPGLRTGPGSGISINHPTSIVSFPDSRDFIVTQDSDGVAYAAFWFRYESSADFEGWLPQLDPERPEDRSVDFMRPYRFKLTEAVTIDKSRRDIFIADASLDSVFKFNSRGRLMAESFGSVRSGGVMKRPTGLAFFEKILYVADADRGAILRFRLSSDVPR